MAAGEAAAAAAAAAVTAAAAELAGGGGGGGGGGNSLIVGELSQWRGEWICSSDLKMQAAVAGVSEREAICRREWTEREEGHQRRKQALECWLLCSLGSAVLCSKPAQLPLHDVLERGSVAAPTQTHDLSNDDA